MVRTLSRAAARTARSEAVVPSGSTRSSTGGYWNRATSTPVVTGARSAASALREPLPSLLLRPQLAGLVCVGLLLAGLEEDWHASARLPLALVAFLVVPGLGLLAALPLRGSRALEVSLVVGSSLAVDLLAARGLLAIGRASVEAMLVVIGGLAFLCLVASWARERWGRA